MTDVESLTDQFFEALHQHPGVYLVGIAGVPGSGKTTLCRSIAARRPDAIVVPMDGYHLPRSRLDAEGMRCRGALHTFDGDAFHADLETLRWTRSGVFPAFDHAEKDPHPGAIRVTPAAPLVIVEGIYVLMRAWRSESLFDLRVFLDCDLDEAVERLTIRHVETGLASTSEEGRHRAVTNDRVNAEVILADGCRERADLILRTGAGPAGTRLGD
jgi:pantothenate kinase